MLDNPVGRSVDECSYARHYPAYKLVRCGSLQLCEVFLSAYKPEIKPLRRDAVLG
jgi:hypothetical protein